jgi:transposase
MNTNTNTNTANTVSINNVDKINSLIEQAKTVSTHTGRRGRPSKITPYTEVIRILRSENAMTYKAIANCLSERGIKINPVSIQLFASKNGIEKAVREL